MQNSSRNMEIGQVNASSLNLDILLSIFSHLDTQSKGRTAQVCKAWKEAIYRKSLWKDYKFALCSRNCNLSTYHNIMVRGINQFQLIGFEPSFYKFLERVPNLESIQLNDGCINDHLLSFLQNPKIKLKRLNVSSCSKFNDRYVDMVIPLLPYLVELDLSSCYNITEKGFRILASSMQKLRILHLNDHDTLPKSSIMGDKISSLTGSQMKDESAASLEYLYLRNGWQLSDSGLKNISRKFVNLVSLELSSSTISDISLRYLVSLKNLKILVLDNCCGITDTGMRSIIQLSNLNSLHLICGCQISDDSFQYISRLVNLKTIYLDSCTKITDTTMRYLAQLKSLRELGLKECPISNNGLAYLSDGELKLTELELSHCRNIGCSGLVSLSQSSFKSTLLVLILNKCFAGLAIPENLVEKFRHLKTLKISYIWDSWKF